MMSSIDLKSNCLQNPVIPPSNWKMPIVSARLRSANVAGSSSETWASENSGIRLRINSSASCSTVRARRRFGLDRAPQFRIRQRGFRERDVLLSRSAWNHAREPIGFTIGKSNDAANVAHRALCIHFVERHNLGDPAFAIFLTDVFQHFAAPVLTKIDVDIGRRNSFRIQESLKDQSELKRI